MDSIESETKEPFPMARDPIYRQLPSLHFLLRTRFRFWFPVTAPPDASQKLMSPIDFLSPLIHHFSHHLNYANERQTVTSWPTDLSRRLDPFHMQMSSQRKCQHDTSIPASPFKALPIPQHPTASPGNLPRIFVWESDVASDRWHCHTRHPPMGQSTASQSIPEHPRASQGIHRASLKNLQRIFGWKFDVALDRWLCRTPIPSMGSSRASAEHPRTSAEPPRASQGIPGPPRTSQSLNWYRKEMERRWKVDAK